MRTLPLSTKAQPFLFLSPHHGMQCQSCDPTHSNRSPPVRLPAGVMETSDMEEARSLIRVHPHVGIIGLISRLRRCTGMAELQ